MDAEVQHFDVKIGLLVFQSSINQFQHLLMRKEDLSFVNSSVSAVGYVRYELQITF